MKLKRKIKKPIKIIRTKKKDWSAHDVEWFGIGSKTPIAYSTTAASDLIGVLAHDNPKMTISKLYRLINYDTEAKKVLQKYIDCGFGNVIASTVFKKSI